MTERKHQSLNLWIALNVTKTVRRLTDEEYNHVVKTFADVNSEPHPNLSLTQPYRYIGIAPDYCGDENEAIRLLDICRAKIAWNNKIVIGATGGGYSIDTDFNHIGKNIHVEAATITEAIAKFTKMLHQ